MPLYSTDGNQDIDMSTRHFWLTMGGIVFAQVLYVAIIVWIGV